MVIAVSFLYEAYRTYILVKSECFDIKLLKLLDIFKKGRQFLILFIISNILIMVIVCVKKIKSNSLLLNIISIKSIIIVMIGHFFEERAIENQRDSEAKWLIRIVDLGMVFSLWTQRIKN